VPQHVFASVRALNSRPQTTQGRFVGIPVIWAVVTLVDMPPAIRRRFCGVSCPNRSHGNLDAGPFKRENRSISQVLRHLGGFESWRRLRKASWCVPASGGSTSAGPSARSGNGTAEPRGGWPERKLGSLDEARENRAVLLVSQDRGRWPHLVRSTFGSCRDDAIEAHSGSGPLPDIRHRAGEDSV
jgi:hypothetical protein